MERAFAAQRVDESVAGETEQATREKVSDGCYFSRFAG
jgi:hypothetical protein